MKRMVALILLCGVTLAAQAMIQLPGWNPGDAGTTRQIWQFDTDANPALPETDENPYGDAVAKVGNTLNPTAFAWGNGMWYGSKFSITMDVPNNPVANPWKEVLVEVIYQGQVTLSWVMDSDWNDFDNLYSCDTDLGNGWIKRVDLWRIEPNPSDERLCYGFNASPTGAPAAVDSITVSTICIPEPVTMLLLSLGAVILRKKK